MNKIKLDLNERSYEILVGSGSLNALPNFLQQKKYSKVFIVMDENIAKFHFERLDNLVGNCEKIVIKAGEFTKSFEFLEKTCEEILSKGIDRKSLIIAFGGGVVGDLTGFISSILLRGVDFVQIPTTLLSMVDSSVGGKTAINSKFGKNLIGSFYQPKLVICDLDFLKTLPKREVKSGYAEVLKYGLVYDEKFFEFLEKNHPQIFSLDEENLKYIISKSCEIKAKIVGGDEKEMGNRALLNFGHTFGHIFETEVNYSDEILHGESVALGMLMAAKMSQNFSLINQEDFNRIEFHLNECGFEVDLMKIRQNWIKENLINHLFKDKKHENGNLTFILLKKIGQAFIEKSVNLQEFEKVLDYFVKN